MSLTVAEFLAKHPNANKLVPDEPDVVTKAVQRAAVQYKNRNLKKLLDSLSSSERAQLRGEVK